MKQTMRENKNKKMMRRFSELGLILLLLLSLFCVICVRNTPAVWAEETGTEMAEETPSPADGDVDVDASVPLVTPAGSAAVAEVIEDSGSGTPENTVSDEPKEFTNDAPSVTITETFVTEDLSETDPEEKIVGMQPASTTYVLTETGQTLKEDDQSKVDRKDAEVTVTAAEPVQPEADPQTGTTPPETVTITRTTVTASQNAIQKAVEEALNQVSDATSALTVTVKAGEYLGDLSITKSDALAMYLSDNRDFTLYILGEGSYDEPAKDAQGNPALIDKDTLTAQADGSVVLNGNVLIDGINVVMAGIYMSLEKMMTIQGGSQVTVYGTAADDGIRATLAGEGAKLTVIAGSGSDTLSVTTVHPDAAGSDRIGNTLRADMGEGDDTVTVEHAAGVMDASIETGAGYDNVMVLCGADAARSGRQGGTAVDSALGISLGADDDTLTMDASAAAAFATVVLSAGSGYDLLEMTGALDEPADDDADPAIWGDVVKTDGAYAGSIHLLAGGQETAMVLEFDGFEMLTDSLENKPSVKVKDLSKVLDVKSFTNYTYEVGDAEEEVSADWTQTGTDILLTNLLVKGDKVTIGTLNMPAVNLKVSAQEILVKGTVTAASITMNTGDDDTLFDFDSTGAGQAASAVGLDGALSGSLFDFNAAASVTVDEGASLNAVNGGVSLTASVDQTRRLIDLLGDATAGINFLNIKVGSAVIRVLGDITSRMTVMLSARANVSMEASNSALASVFVPLAFVLAVTEASIEIMNARIKSGQDVTADAASSVDMKAEASTGSLPLSVSVAIAVNDAHVTVGGTSAIEADRNVALTANGVTGASASAGRGQLAGDTSAYVAVEVAVQDCAAQISDKAGVNAGGDITVSSAASLTGSAVATSAMPQTPGGEEEAANTASGGLASVKELLLSVGQKMLETGMTRISQIITGVAPHVFGKAYRITVENTENGTVSAPPSANGHEAATGANFQTGVKYYTRGANGVYTPATVTAGAPIPKSTAYYVDAAPVRLVITPKDGYRVQEVAVTYLLKGAAQQETVSSTQANNKLNLIRNADGSYSFAMPEADVKVKVTFAEGTDDSTAEAETQDAGLNDLFNEAVSGTQEEEEEKDSQNKTAVTVTIEYTDTYTPVTGTPTGEFYEKNETDNTYTLVTGQPAQGVTYYKRNSAFGITDDDYVRTDKEYFTREADGTYKPAQLQVNDEIPKNNTVYDRRGAVLTAVTKVDPLTSFTVTVNPAPGMVATAVNVTYKTPYAKTTDTTFKEGVTYYLLEDGAYKSQTVKAGESVPTDKIYYIKDDTNLQTVNDTIVRGTDGKYTYIMPDGVSAEGIRISAWFDKKENAPAGSPGSAPAAANAASAQSAGALAGGVNINHNDALITTTGTVEAGGTVSVTAVSSAVGTVTADGTAVTKDAPEEAVPETPAGANDSPQITAPQNIVPYTVYLEPSNGAALKQAAGTDAAKGVFVLQVVDPTGKYSRDSGKVTSPIRTRQVCSRPAPLCSTRRPDSIQWTFPVSISKQAHRSTSNLQASQAACRWRASIW